VIVYVADSIHAINLQVRKKATPERALRLATAASEKILGEVKTIIDSTFEPEECARVHFARWDDLYDDQYKNKLSYLYSLYQENTDFKSHIHNLVRAHTSREDKQFTESDIDKLGTYIIEELPEVLCRIPIKGLTYDAYVYPYDGELPKFVDDLQQGVLFPEIKERILDTEPKVFLEVR
jgi:hypothetical protein